MGQNRFSKNLIFKRFAAKFFSKVSRRFSEGQKGSVNLTFNAFLHKKIFFYVHFCSRGSKRGSVNLCFGRRGGGSAARGGG